MPYRGPAWRMSTHRVLDKGKSGLMRNGTVFSLLLLALAVAACGRKATPEQCKTACARVAKLKVATQQAQGAATIHETEEMAEAAEKTGKADMERVRAEMAAPAPAFDDKPFRARKAPAKEIQAARERHEWEAKQLAQQRAAAIQRTEEMIASEHKRVAEVKQKVQADLAKATQEAEAACAERCVKESSDRAECLGRTQAASDVDLCWGS